MGAVSRRSDPQKRVPLCRGAALGVSMQTYDVMQVQARPLKHA